MKRIAFVLFSLCCLSTAMGQLKARVKCPDLYIDVLNGTVNDIKPNYTPNEIKEKFPCFTSAQDESDSAKCGGGVFYKDKDVYFFTDRDYIEIREKFQGKLSIPVMGATRNSLFNSLGNPRVKDDTWDAFEMSYGTLVLHYNKAGKVGLILGHSCAVWRYQ